MRDWGGWGRRWGKCEDTGRNEGTRGRWTAGDEAAEVDDVVGLGGEGVDPNEMTVRPE
jgi:hypothetical protein